MVVIIISIGTGLDRGLGWDWAVDKLLRKPQADSESERERWWLVQLATSGSSVEPRQ